MSRSLELRPRPASPLLPVVVGYAALIALMMAPGGMAYPSVIVSLAAYPGFLLVFPACRPDMNRLVCPKNWAMIVFFVQLVGLPLLIAYTGIAAGNLPRLPRDLAINVAMLLATLAYGSFCWGFQTAAARPARPASTGPRPPDPAKSRAFLVGYAVLGIVGLACAFGSPGGLIAYFTQPGDSKVMKDETSSLKAAAGTFLRPFLGFAFVALWCNWVDRRGRVGPHVARAARTALMAIPVVVSYSTFNYNRGAFFAPLVAMSGVYMARVKRLSIPTLAALGSTVIGFIMLLGLYRSGGLGLDEIAGDSNARAELADKLDTNAEIQIYGAAPQFLGFILDESDFGRRLYWGSTLASSILYPIPIIGERFRPSSGVVLYNAMIYGRDGNLDQILPFQGELFLNFHIPGIAAGYFALGLLAGWLQSIYERATTALRSYIAMYAAVWLLFLIQGGIAPVSQIYIYFFWPVYVYLAALWAADQFATGRVTRP